MTDFKKKPEGEVPARTAAGAENGRGRPDYGRGRRDAYSRPGGGADRRRGAGGRADGERERPDTRRERAPRGEFSAEQRDGRYSGATGALIDLDKDLMKLLVRRATLVSRIRGGRDHASTPEAIQAEKAVRLAWEAGALAFSKDPQFTRQLFTLLQDVKVLSKEQAENAGSFNLSPPRSPVAGEIAGPAGARAIQMYTALAACRGNTLCVEAVPLSGALMDTVKVCAQAGAAVSCHNRGTGLGGIAVEPGAPVSFAGKMMFLGEDFFTLCLMTFLAIGQPGSCRLTGGARLKAADLSSLRQALPLFGARLAHVVPRSQGLPATLESSGAIPPLVVVPADLPFEAVCALLLAPLAWNVPVAFNLASLPASVATAALAEVGPVHVACGADVENRGSHFAYSPGPLSMPESPQTPLDPVLSAYLLALPAFTGGSLTLKGRWPALLPEGHEVEQLLAWAGLRLRILDGAVCAEVVGTPFALPLQCNDLSFGLGPLFLVLAARQHTLNGKTPPLRTLAPFPADETDEGLAQDFFERMGLVYADGQISSSATSAGESSGDGQADAPPRPPLPNPGPAPAWTSPDAYWSMALALAAFIRPGLKLANPGNVSEVMPMFWGIYNTLPNPVDPASEPRETKKEDKDAKPARRRIIAD